MYRIAKTYGHDLGLSCCYRQHNSTSHCRFLHGYALGVRLEFISFDLEEGWVLDFGGLKQVKQSIIDLLDHRTLVAIDDPKFDEFQDWHNKGLIQMKVMPVVSCEGIAEHIYCSTTKWLTETHWYPRVRLTAVTVSEHGSNQATYFDVVDATLREQLGAVFVSRQRADA